jgi:hypothetical protein
MSQGMHPSAQVARPFSKNSRPLPLVTRPFWQVTCHPWGWGGNGDYLDSCEIQVDRGDGKGFVLLTIDTTPNYTDTQPFPATPTRWTYRAIYRANDAQVGVWSQTVSVTVPA